MKQELTKALSQGDNTPVVLVGTDGKAEVSITSVELIQLINEFRKEEGNPVEKRHDDLLKSIRNEIEVLRKAGIVGDGNFSETSYTDSWNREKPCYSMNKAGVLQMLNKESAVVRYKTVQYIDKLEQVLKGQQNPYAHLSQELQAIFAIDHKQQEMDSRITKLENTMTIDYGQQNDLQGLVSKKVISVLGGADAPAYKNKTVSQKAFKELYRMLKRIFKVNSYKNIAVKDLERAKETIPQWEPSEELQLMIQGANAQIRLSV